MRSQRATVGKPTFARSQTDPSCANCSFQLRHRSRTTTTILRQFRTAGSLLSCAVMLKRFVYVLRNDEIPPRYYTGLTSNVANRQVEHNAGSCVHTAKHRPWSIDVVIEFADERRAVVFERYLKFGSGVAFARRHLR